MRTHPIWLLIPWMILLGCPGGADDVADDDAADDDVGDDDTGLPAGELSVEDAAAVILGIEEHADIGFNFDTGDLNGDGVDDLVVDGDIPGDGEIYVFHGPLNGARTIAEADAVITTGPEWHGSWLTGVADVDRDGVDDVLVGSHTADSPPAYARGFRGPLAAMTSVAEADFLFTVDEPGWIDRIVEVVPAGDMDGDGEEDLAVRIQGPEALNDDDQVGIVLVLSEAIEPGPIPIDLTAPRIFWTGYDAMSMTPQRVGDVDGDGLDDLMIHVLDHKSEIMDSYLFPGPLESVPQVVDAAASVDGYAAAGNFGRPGDVDGDGRHDLVSREYWIWEGTPGDAWVFFGLEEGTWTHADADAHIRGVNNADFMGAGASIGGDLDGDGRHDLVLGAWGDDAVVPEGGVTYLWTEVPEGELDLTNSALRIHGAHEGEGSGMRLLAGGDLDGDGLDDLLVGAPGTSSGPESGGAIYLFTGAQIRAALSP